MIEWLPWLLLAVAVVCIVRLKVKHDRLQVDLLLSRGSLEQSCITVDQLRIMQAQLFAQIKNLTGADVLVDSNIRGKADLSMVRHGAFAYRDGTLRAPEQHAQAQAASQSQSQS